MPITYSAKKALRRDRRRTAVNQKIKTAYKEALKKAEKTGTGKNLDKAYSLVDRAAKKGIIHKNKAARIKSRLVKFLQKPKQKIVKKKTKAKGKKVKQKRKTA